MADNDPGDAEYIRLVQELFDADRRVSGASRRASVGLWGYGQWVVSGEAQPGCRVRSSGR